MTITQEELDSTRYSVVVNGERQHSIWPADKQLPSGWAMTGKFGPRDECLAHIDEVWKDMRPYGLQKK